MTQRSAILAALGAFFLSAVLLVGAALWVVRPGGGPPATQPSAVGGPFALIDQNGNKVTDQDLKGRPFLVFFGFTHCPDVCPTALFETSEVLARLQEQGKSIDVLFVTVDPERDTPEVMKSYIASFNPKIRGLTGDRAAVDAMIKAYRVYARKVPTQGDDYTMDHTAVIYLMDKDGRFVAPVNMKRKDSEIAADLARYL